MSEEMLRDEESATQGIARHGRLPKPSAARTALKGAAAVLAVVLVSTGSVAAFATWDLARTVQANAVDISDGKAPPPSLRDIDGGANILLVGSDSRDGQGDGYGDPKKLVGEHHNDVTMLLHISQDHSRATVVSFPRDMLVDQPACASDDGQTRRPAVSGAMFNTALARGGLGCVVRTVESITGLDIPYGGVVQFTGVIGISNAVGGVPVCLANPINDEKYSSLRLPAGENVLHGEDALQFLRTRHGVSDGSDIGRISNQQVFLSALVRTLTSSGTLSNPATVYGIARAIVENMTLSTSLDDPSAIASLAVTLKGIPLDRITFVQYPNFRVGARVVPDVTAANQMTHLIATDADFALAPDRDANGVVLDPGAAAAPHASPAPPSPAPATGSAPAPDASGATVLPKNVMGQTADVQSCSNKRDR